jgi:hypothetical protein
MTPPPDRKPRSSAIAMKYVEGAAYKVMSASVAKTDSHRSASDGRVGERLAAPMHTALTVDDAAIGHGTELALNMAMEPGDRQGLVLRDTVKEPELVTARASVERLRMLDALAVVEQGLDTAETIQPRNSLERMLAHQLATTHAMAMRFMATAQEYLCRAHPDDYGMRRMDPRTASTEAARLAGTASRMMATFQEGMVALAKVRSGGRQTMKVIHQYVQVNEGGQAVVAGKVTRGKGAKRKAGMVSK